MIHTHKRFYLVLISSLLPFITIAQQYIGLDTRQYAAIQKVPTNPAWITNSKSGMEASLFSISALAGTNAFSFSKKYVFQPFDTVAIEDVNYKKDITEQTKHLWANVEINGPSISLQYKEEHYLGIYTRARQIYRAGGLDERSLQLIGQSTPKQFYNNNIQIDKAGLLMHSFAEIGFTYGRVLYDDYYHIFSAGATVKYLMGFAAGSVYTNSFSYTPDSLDDVHHAKGDLNALYTYNISSYVDENVYNDINSWQRAGRGSLGIDIGARYEFHPDGNPNKNTPYLFSIAASITDVGSVRYIADTGSATYDIDIDSVKIYQYHQREFEPINDYLVRIEGDTLLGEADHIKKFNIGLPTAFRLNADYNASEHFNLAINVLLNLRGNTKINYRPGYVSYFNLTPSYYRKNIRIGMPFTVVGYQTITAGAYIQAGPFYVGSSSALSMLMFNKIKTFDLYAGLVWKFKDKTFRRY